MKSVFHRALLLALSISLGACAASSLHHEGLADIERGEYEAGVGKLTDAVQKDPGNLTFRIDLAARRSEAVQKLIATADGMRANGQLDDAATTYRRVLALE